MNQTVQKQQQHSQFQREGHFTTTPPFCKKSYDLDFSSTDECLRYKISLISSLELSHLTPIDNIKREANVLTLYYDPVPHRLSDFLFSLDHDLIKVLHRQFIQLAIGLAKVGIVTVFDGKCCGILLESGRLKLKYYLMPDDIDITEDLESIEESVSTFSMEALRYMKNGPGKQTTHTLHTCASDRSLNISHYNITDCRQTLDARLVSSKQQLNQQANEGLQRCRQEESFRRLSILSKEFTEISARYQSRKTSRAEGPISSLKACGESGHSNEQLTRLSDHSQLYDSGNMNQLLTRTLSSVSRLKKAQKQLCEIRERLQPYKSVLSILRNIKTLG